MTGNDEIGGLSFGTFVAGCSPKRKLMTRRPAFLSRKFQVESMFGYLSERGASEKRENLS